MAITTTVRGLDDILGKFKKLPERVANNAARRSLRKGANVIRDLARNNAKQIDDPQTRDAIYKNIATQSGGRRRERAEGGLVMRVGVMGGASSNKYSKDASGNPGGDTRHWRYVEFGTSEMPAQPFMRPAIPAGGEKAAAVIAEDLNKQLDKEIAKL